MDERIFLKKIKKNMIRKVEIFDLVPGEDLLWGGHTIPASTIALLHCLWTGSAGAIGAGDAIGAGGGSGVTVVPALEEAVP